MALSEVLDNDLPEIELTDQRQRRPYSRYEMDKMAQFYSGSPDTGVEDTYVPQEPESVKKQSLGMNVLNTMGFVLGLPMRPVKAILNAHHETGEVIMDEVESLGAGIPLLTTLKAAPRIAGAFLEGLKGHGGASEYLKDLGVKNMSDEEFQVEMDAAQADRKLTKNLGFVGDLGFSIQQMVKHKPAEFWGDVADGLVVEALIPFAATGAMKKAVGFASSYKQGIATRAQFVSALGKENAEKVIGLIHESQLPGGGGYEGFLNKLKTFPKDIQQKIKERVAANDLKMQAPKFAGERVADPAVLPMEQAKSKLRETLKNKYAPGVEDVDDKSLESILRQRIGDGLKRHMEDPTEQALGRMYMRTNATDDVTGVVQDGVKSVSSPATIGRTAGDNIATSMTMRKMDHAAQEQLWGALKKSNPKLTGEEFLDMNFDDVINAMPDDIGKPYRGSMNLAKTINDEYGLFSKSADELTDLEVDKMMEITGDLFNKDTMLKDLDNIKMSMYGKTDNPVLDPTRLGRIMPARHVLESMGMKDDFFNPVLIATHAEEAAKSATVNRFRKALEPVNKMGMRSDWDGSFKRIFDHLDGKEGISLSKAEITAADNVKGILEEMADEFGIPKDKRLSNYITHIFKKDGSDFSKATFDASPSITNKFIENMRTGVDGYETNLIEALEAYTNVGYRNKFRKGVHAALKDKAKSANLPKHAARYVEDFLDDYAGHSVPSSVIEPLIKNIVQSPLKHLGVRVDSHEMAQKVAYNALQLGYATGLGLNFKATVRNYFQRFMAAPRTSMKAYGEAEAMGNKVWATRYGKYTNDPEVAAAKAAMEDSLALKQRIGDPTNMRPDVEATGKIFKTPMQRIGDKAIQMSGFNLAEKGNFSKTYLAGLKHEMNRRGIKNFVGLLKHSAYKEIREKAEEMAFDTQLIYNRVNRPLALRNMEGPFIMQYGTFGLNMMPLAMRDFLLPHNRTLGIKTLLHQATLGAGLSAVGLNGMGYAGYFGALEPVQRLAKLSSDNPEKAITSPALRASFGALQAGVGVASGNKKLQKQGVKNIKSVGNTAFGRAYTESKNFNDPSRMFLYKPYPKKKKKS